MNFFVKNFFILFFIILVISITPGFAVKVGDSFNYNDTEKILSDLDKKTNDLETLENELKYHAIIIIDGMNFIMSNAFKLWKYKEVKEQINRITKESKELYDLTNMLTSIVKDIESDSIKLDDSLSKIKSNNSYSDEDFLKGLENRTNTTFDISDPINFKQGDIVQYKGQKGNSKYLEYVKIDNTTHYVILKNSVNKRIALSQEFFNKTATQKISPKTPNPQIISTINNLQHEKINTTKNQIQETIQIAKEMEEEGGQIGNFALDLLVVIVICCFLGICVCFEPVFYIGLIATILLYILLPSFVILVVIASNMETKSHELLDNARKDLKGANALEADLSKSLNSFPFAADVNLTAPAGVSVNGTLNGTDFDGNNLTYTIVEQPKHGKLNITENGSFKYASNNNFTGKDSFKYKVNDGIVDSNTATVDITVLPITKMVMSNIKGKVGDRVSFTATLSNNNGKGIANATIIFKLNNTVIGNAKTNEKGIAILNYKLKYNGKFTLLAIFLGNPLYANSNCTSLITIDPKK